MKKYKAVIFDLFGTLIDDMTNPEANLLVHVQSRNEMADALGVNREDFAKEWTGATNERMAGIFPSTKVALSQVCGRLGAEPGEDVITTVAESRIEYTQSFMSPRRGVVETLSTLRGRGFKVGLISNCMEEVSRLWDSTPFASLFDVVILSIDVRLAKPDRRIYELAAERLGVEATECLYVGDGSDGELTGAARVGMTAVLMRAPYDQEDGGREGWEGERISRIAEVLGLV